MAAYADMCCGFLPESCAHRIAPVTTTTTTTTTTWFYC
jgi:hypothetical protein